MTRRLQEPTMENRSAQPDSGLPARDPREDAGHSGTGIDRVFKRVSNETAIRVGRVIGGISMLAAAASVLVFVALGELDVWYEEWGVHNAVGGFLFGLLLFVAVRRQPRNGAVWAIGWSGLFQSVTQALAAAATAGLVIDRLGRDALESYRSLDNLPGEILFFDWLGHWSWIPALGLMMAFGFLLFPDGHPPSRRWRFVGWLAAISMVGATIGMMTSRDRGSSAQDVDLPLLTRLLLPVLGIAVLLSVASLFFRYRRAGGDQRLQLRWVAYAATLFGVSSVATFTIDVTVLDSTGGSLNQPVTLLVLPLVVGAYAVAILKYRLYDIDVVISKSVTYLGLAAAITLLYAAVVVGPLLIIGLPDEGGPGLALPLVATAVVAVLFEPIRLRMHRWANRLVYGRRSTPQEVLSQVTAQLSESGNDGGTNDLAKLLAEGTGADRAVVWLQSGDTLEPEGSWPADRSASIEPILSTDLADDDFTFVTEVRHGEDRLGALSISKPRNDPVTPADRELVSDVAAGAGLVLRNIGLNRQLKDRARQVRESRLRLIAAQDTERHRLERDLHDGAQQQVVALKVKLGLARTIADRAGADDVASVLSGLTSETQQAVDALRTVAHGIYPPLLEAEGLEVALRAMERSSTGPLVIETTGVTRYARHTEETVYFCVLEALERARMSGARSIRVGLTDRAGELIMEIDHDGHVTEVDLTALSDRVDAFGGNTAIETRSGEVTRITSRIPAGDPALEPV